jgi:hypothetical protein
MDSSVPSRSAAWSGTGTVVVVPSPRFCMTTWLPRRRTSTKPLRARIVHTSRPESTRSLPTRDVQPGNVHFGMEAAVHLGRVGSLEE